MTKETLLRIPTKKGSISGGLSNDIIGEIKGYLKSGKSWRLEYLIGEIYDLLTGYRSNFGGKLQSIDFDDDGEFNNKSKNEKIRELKKCLGKVIKESENLWRQQYECDKEVYKKEVEEIRGLIRRCFRDYRQLSKKEDRDLEGYYKVGYFVKVKIEGDKDPCTAKILEIDKEHNRVRIEYIKKERIG